MHTGLRTTLVAATLFSTSLGRIITISVSGGGFGPSSNQANVGDQITISFTVGTASFTQSSFDQPCVPVSGGLNSGTITILPGQGPKPYTFTVENTTPLFFFNANSDACRNGFVGSINATPQQSSQFLTNAKTSSTFIVVPPSQQVTSAPQTPPPSAPNPAPTSIPSNSVVDPPSPSPTVVDISLAPSVNSGQTTSQSSSLASVLASPLAVTLQFSLSTFSPTPVHDTGGTTSSLQLGGMSSMSLTFSPTAIHGIPGYTSQPIPSASSNLSHNNTRILAVVFGIVLGIATLLASAFAFIAIRRRRHREALLPQTHRPYPDSDSRSSLKPVGWTIQSVRRVLARLTSVRLVRGWGWNRLEEKEQRRVSPYLAQVNTPVVEVKARRSHNPVVWVRHLSEATLVPSVRSTETSNQSDTSDMSLVVNVPRSEKGEDMANTPQKRIDLETYPFVLSTPSGNARLQRQFPSSTSDTSG